MNRVLMIAGEASGDMHGAGVVRELKRRDPSLDIFGVGGDCMRGEGMDLRVHIARLSFMGFVEVLKNLSTVRAVERDLEVLLESRRPDVVVLIDYPGFNLRFARTAKKHGIPVLYYISPQVWAWNKGRVKKMRRLVDRMKVVFPFEVEIYRKEGIDVEFVGHPLVERLGSSITREVFCATVGLDPSKRILGLFPGSRLQEIENILPVMANAAAILGKSHSLQVVVGVASNLGRSTVERFLPPGVTGVQFAEHATYDLMRHADAAIVTSGTATLEAGWFGTPMTVVYRTSPITFFIGRMLVDVPYIGLVNIVAGQKVVQEFVQHDMTVENLVGELGRLLDQPDYVARMKTDLAVIKNRLGDRGASARVADGILALGGRV